MSKGGSDATDTGKSQRKPQGWRDRGETTDVIEEVVALQQRINQLEAGLIMLVRTGDHYENQGIEDDGGTLRDSFAAALKEARTLLGLEHRSVLTRTEPRT